MQDVNNVCLTGNLTRDAEEHGTQGTRQYAVRFSIANNSRKFNQETQAWEDSPNFFDCVVFGNFATSTYPLLRKGCKVSVSGKLRQRKWQAQDGSNRSAVDVVCDNVILLANRDKPKPDASDDDLPF